MQGETAPADGEPVLKECILRDGIEYCRPVSPEGIPLDEGSGAGTDYLAWARPVLDDPAGWVRQYLLNLDFLLPVLYQLGAVLAALLLGALIAPPLHRQAEALIRRLPENLSRNIDETVPRLVRPALWALLLYVATVSFTSAGLDGTLVRIATSLALAWLLIRLVTTFLVHFFERYVEQAIEKAAQADPAATSPASR